MRNITVKLNKRGENYYRITQLTNAVYVHVGEKGFRVGAAMTADEVSDLIDDNPDYKITISTR